MQVNVLSLVKTGQIAYIEDARGNSWPFGVYNILNRELVSCQALGRRSTPLTIGASNCVTLVIPKENGAYLIEAEIDESDEKRYRMVLRPTGEVKYVQRRQYFRISKPSILAHYKLIDAETHDDDSMPVESLVWDLSGSGIGIIVKATKTIYSGAAIKLIISLPGESPIEIVGEVSRAVPKSIIRSQYLLGIYFKKIRESDRNKIVKFVTQEQLALRSKKKR